MLVAQFDAIAEAPGGVQRLRELILQLAVRGKLVPQEVGDEPASVLIARIEAEKERLFREGKIGKPRKLPPIAAEDVPFEVPEGWVWVRFAEIIELISGQHLMSPDYNDHGDGIPYLTGPADFGEQVPTATRWTHERRAVAKQGDVLLTVKGAGVGRTNVLGYPEAAISRQLMAICPIRVDASFVNLLAQSATERFRSEQVGIAIPGIGRADVLHLAVPLPPFPEQHRIVAKVDQLMALCDELEDRQRRRAEQRARLNRSVLHHLAAAEDDDELAAHWQRIQENFDLLYNAPEIVTELRQAIFQLAVRGKLVPQDPRDEPASVLVERIEAAKERLAKEGKIGKPKKLAPVEAGEVPFGVPEGWEWVRLGQLGVFMGGGTPSKSDPSLWDGSIPWVSPKDMKQPYITDSADHISEDALSRSAVRLIPEGALLMVVRGMILARAFPTALTRREVTVNQDMKALALFEQGPAEFLLRALKALEPAALLLVERSTHGTCRLGSDSIEQFPVPLPPLPEQHRIVAKVDQLMALCDELEAKLTRSRAQADRLAAAVVHHFTAA
jgi:type I restriction enzyme S subunit